MSDTGSPFSSAEERLAFSQAVDLLDVGDRQLIEQHLIDRYVDLGLLERDGDRLRLTPSGREQDDIARRERTAVG